jgi:hypothetical protein
MIWDTLMVECHHVVVRGSHFSLSDNCFHYFCSISLEIIVCRIKSQSTKGIWHLGALHIILEFCLTSKVVFERTHVQFVPGGRVGGYEKDHIFWLRCMVCILHRMDSSGCCLKTLHTCLRIWYHMSRLCAQTITNEIILLYLVQKFRIEILLDLHSKTSKINHFLSSSYIY